jgi:hypothetical protein
MGYIILFIKNKQSYFSSSKKHLWNSRYMLLFGGPWIFLYKNPGHHIAFSHHSSMLSLPLTITAPQTFLLLLNLTVFKINSQGLFRMSLRWDLPDIFLIIHLVMVFWKDIQSQSGTLELGMGVHACNLSTWRLKQVD